MAFIKAISNYNKTKFILYIFAFLIWQTVYAQENAINPILHADVPDMSIIRVGNTYYMSSTTMHMSPGLPLMSSKDLVNWKLESYAYDTLVNNDAMRLEKGQSAYGRGSWASCLRYHHGMFYVSTFSATSGKTHIYSSANIKGPWNEKSFSPAYHDHTLFFDDDGKVYMIYGAGNLKILEMKSDLSGINTDVPENVLIEDASAPAGNNIMLRAEGSQLFKIQGKYYLFNITWPRGGMRTVVVHRAENLQGPWEGRLGLQDRGVAQGGLINTPDGRWFAYLFRDNGGVGRIPYLVPVQWVDGWPVLGESGKVPMKLLLPANKSLIPGIVHSDEFKRKKKKNSPLPIVWQWNHNPVNGLWSLEDRKGFLRLKTGRTDTSLVSARNTLTQRTIGPECSGYTSLDVSGLKEGDYAGLCLLQKNFGQLGVKRIGNLNRIVLTTMNNNVLDESQNIPLDQNKVYFKATCDFKEQKDLARFYYSLDGRKWQPIGDFMKMPYTLPHFMGYRFGLFHYATKQIGGFVDFDYFRITNSIK